MYDRELYTEINVCVCVCARALKAAALTVFMVCLRAKV